MLDACSRPVTSCVRRGRPAGRTTLTTLAYVAGWAVVAVPVGAHAFLTDTRDTVIASHDATISPAADGYATLDLGAFLPNLRYPAGVRIGVSIDLGKTNVANYDALVHRYAVIASRPEGEIRKVRGLLTDMAIEGALEGAAVGLLGPGVWLLMGRQRRRQLVSRLSWRTTAIGVALVVVVASAIVFEPWNNPAEPSAVDADVEASWQPIAALVPETDIPAEAQPLQVQTGLVTSSTKSLIQSAFDTYRTSIEFYRTAADNAPDLSGDLHQPGADETVAILVSDRHDNVGMDLVVRSIADTAGATVLLDAGDDTSTGGPWEAFSLDSLAEAFQDDEKYAVTGNHDEGPFVSEYLDNLGFTVLTGTSVDGVDGIRLLGDADPRSSGLGSWRTAVVTTLSERGTELADAACASNDAGNASAPCWCTTPPWAGSPSIAGVSISCSPAISTCRSGRSRSPARTAWWGRPTPMAPQEVRPTRSPSAASFVATPRPRSSPIATGRQSGCRR